MTEATEAARARSRALRAALVAANPDRLCPLDHRHGATGTCYSGHGCRCAGCRDTRAKRKRAEYYGLRKITRADLKVSAVGTQRRLQALAFMGWSCQVIAERIGSHYRPLIRLRDGGRTNVMRSTHDRVATVFEELCMVKAPGHSGRVTRGWAKRKGFASPLAWVDLDDPVDVPSELGRSRSNGVDRELVYRLWGEGLSDARIADRVGCSARHVVRIRAEMQLETRWAA